jgi:hypothetical protein
MEVIIIIGRLSKKLAPAGCFTEEPMLPFRGFRTFSDVVCEILLLCTKTQRHDINSSSNHPSTESSLWKRRLHETSRLNLRFWFLYRRQGSGNY